MTTPMAQEYVNQLTDKGIIQLTGDERVKYLQGQVTADINQLSDNQALLSCHCDFKGKIWSVFYTFAWQDSILLLTHQSVLAKSLAELNKYGVFAKVDIADGTENWTVYGGKGKEFEYALQQSFGQLPVDDKTTVSNENGIVMAIKSPTLRYLVLQPKDTKIPLSLPANPQTNLWEVDDIRSGLGDIRDSSVSEYVPQMLNLQLLDAIDFQKGCYMGQEVVARTKYLGRNKKAGFILKANSVKQELVSEQLEFQIGDNWRPVGKILRSANDQANNWAFAVLAKDTELGASFRVKSQPDIIFKTQSLPYDLD